MTYARRLHIANEIAARAKQHKPREHLVQELKALTTKSLQREIRWGWLRRYVPSERALRMIGLAIGSAMYVSGIVGRLFI